MTKKKRELIEILLDNITPDDWPVEAKWAAQDKETMTWGKNKLMFYKQDDPPFAGTGSTRFSGNMNGDNVIKLPELCKKWSKAIITRDEFVKRWNERNAQGEKKTPQQLALEKFGTDWHENDGVQPVEGDVLVYCIGDNGINGGPLKAENWNFKYKLDKSKPEFAIKKWRVHSETDATTQPAQQEAHTEETKPIQQEVKATDTQIGGNHYTKLAIQPMRYSMENGLDALQHTVIKYVTRFRDKNGIEDLEKAKHCIDMLIEYEKESK